MKKLIEKLVWLFGIILLLFVLMVLIWLRLFYGSLDINIILLVGGYIVFLVLMRILDLKSFQWITRDFKEDKEMLRLRIDRESQLSLYSSAIAFTLIISGITSELFYLTLVGMFLFLIALFQWLYQVQPRYKKLEEVIKNSDTQE
jgi:1,4-dihydroxy-2-naphthoate octaprenyltransferase